MSASRRASSALRDAAHAVRVDALAALDEGRTHDYDRLCQREAQLVRASGWAAVIGDHHAIDVARAAGVDVHDEDDEDTITTWAGDDVPLSRR